MTRIFSSLAVFAVLMLAANFLVGLSIGDFNGQADALREAQREVDRFRLLAPQEDDPRWQAARANVARLSAEIGPSRRLAGFHKLFGIAGALISLLVNSVAITYFVGTSKWCGEVSETYRLDLGRVERIRRLKRRAFASGLVSMLIVVLLSGLGAAADPGNSQSGGQQWATAHLIVASIAIVVIAGLFWLQAGRVQANYALIQEIMDDVRAVRDERGIDERSSGAAATGTSA